MADTVNANYITTTGGISGLRANGGSIAAANGKGRYFRGASLQPGTSTTTVVIYDNTTNSGDPICVLQAATSDKSVLSPDYRIPLQTGLYCVLTGTGSPSAVLYVE